MRHPGHWTGRCYAEIVVDEAIFRDLEVGIVKSTSPRYVRGMLNPAFQSTRVRDPKLHSLLHY